MTRDWTREKLILARRSAGETFSSIGAAFGIKRQRAHAIWKRNQPKAIVVAPIVATANAEGDSARPPNTFEEK
ncbi:MAG: hypothetical protein JNN30_16525 [Rhodanobacteraceae bacterium]|nr:hypothetical protein [Rhodanobacteraceae bacterium]